MKNLLIFALSTLFFLTSCGSNNSSPDDTPQEPCTPKTIRPSATSWTGGFAAWLTSNGYAHIAANQGWGGNDGACTPSADKDPVILLHGNSSTADPSASFLTFKNYLLSAGYQSCDLFAITWIEANTNGTTIHHKADYMLLVRDFILAVKAYTGKSKVDIIGWSMGVTIGRKSVKGGGAYNDPGRTPSYYCDLGENLSAHIDTFVGVAGVNRGLSLCAGGTSNSCSENAFKVDSGFLVDLNGGSAGTYSPEGVAGTIYSLYLPDDEYICGDNPRGLGFSSCAVFGTHTSRIPAETAGLSFDVNNTLFPSDPWGTNDYCAYDPASPSQAQMKCDHITVFFDNLTTLTPATSEKGALYVLMKLLRDNDTTYTSGI